MPSFRKTPQFEHGRAQTAGVLLVNLGTPDAPTPAAVRRFLKQFLSDPRVVEYPRALWWLILNLVILRIRPARSAAAYRKIWTDEGSPLLLNSQAIATKLRTQLGARDVHIELGMSYGSPSIAEGIDKLLIAGVSHLIVLPLYPQYSGTTTASVFDAVTDKLSTLRWVPSLQFIDSYHDHPAYISALAHSVLEYRSAHGTGDKLMLSFHGTPRSTLDNGDPYFCQCHKTARLLAAELNLDEDEWLLTFQSRVGREEWLRPYTDETILALAGQGLQRLDVICPGFATDCLETLEEIALQNAAAFRAAGGDELRYIPALNACDQHIELLAALTHCQLDAWRASRGAGADDRTKERAKALGAKN